MKKVNEQLHELELVQKHERLKAITKDGVYILGTSKKIEDIPPKAQDIIIEILEEFSN